MEEKNIATEFLAFLLVLLEKGLPLDSMTNLPFSRINLKTMDINSGYEYYKYSIKNVIAKLSNKAFNSYYNGSLKVDIEFVLGDCVNAFAKRVSEDYYKIKFHEYNIDILTSQFSLLFKCHNIMDTKSKTAKSTGYIFQTQDTKGNETRAAHTIFFDKDINRLCEIMTMLAIKFILYHEIAHVFYGHVEYLCKENQFEKIDIRKALEYDADTFAINSIFLDVFRLNGRIHNEKTDDPIFDGYSNEELVEMILYSMIGCLYIIRTNELQTDTFHPNDVSRFMTVVNTINLLNNRYRKINDEDLLEKAVRIMKQFESFDIEYILSQVEIVNVATGESLYSQKEVGDSDRKFRLADEMKKGLKAEKLHEKNYETFQKIKHDIKKYSNLPIEGIDN